MITNIHTQCECRMAPFSKFARSRLTKLEEKNEAKEKNRKNEERGKNYCTFCHPSRWFTIIQCRTAHDYVSVCVCAVFFLFISFKHSVVRLLHSAERVHIVCYFTKEMKSIFIATLTAIAFVQLNFYVLDMFLLDIFSCSAMFPIYEFTLVVCHIYKHT